MFGFFKKNDDLVVLNQKLGRLLNVYAKADMDDKRRSESRVRLAMPCLIFLYKEAAAPQSYASGITADVSLHGMGVYTYDNLEEGEYILVFGPKDLRMHVAASCKRFVRSDLNSNSAAFSFIRVMSGKEIQPINDAIEILEASRSAESTNA